MQKSGLGLLFSFLLAIFLSPHVLAAQDSAAGPVVKQHHSKRVHHKARQGSTVVRHERIVRRVVFLHGKRRTVYQRVSYARPIPSEADELAGFDPSQGSIALKSNVAYIMDATSSEVLFEKNADAALPIASITK